MLLIVATALALAYADTAVRCADPVIQDKLTSQPWRAEDQQALERAQTVCALHYAPRSPCLVRFERVRVRTYHAVCGPASAEATIEYSEQ